MSHIKRKRTKIRTHCSLCGRRREDSTFSFVLTHTMRTSEGLWRGHSKGFWALRGFKSLSLSCCFLFHYNPLTLSISDTSFLHAVLFVSLSLSVLQSLPFCVYENLSYSCLSVNLSFSLQVLSPIPFYFVPWLFISVHPYLTYSRLPSLHNLFSCDRKTTLHTSRGQ